MLEPDAIARYLDLKARVAAAVSDPDSGFARERREWSEGLARTCAIGGEPWTYSASGDGWSFTSPDGTTSVAVSNDPARNACFTPNELAAWLQAGGRHARITTFVVDNWLLRAEIAGHVERAPDQRGCWRLR